MSTCIETARNNARTWLEAHPKMQQWLWFVALWCLGLAAVLLLSYPIKMFMRSLS